MYKIAICDDNEKDRKVIIKILEGKLINYGDYIIYEYDSGIGLVNDISKEHDLIFIDIYMKNMDGNETAKHVRKINESAVLAFCSGMAEPTLDSFKSRPYRYIMKNLPKEMIERDIEDLLVEMKECKKKRYIIAYAENKIFKINIDDILYISKRKRGSDIFVIEKLKKQLGGEVYSKEHINDLYAKLNDFGFVSAHDSYIVNINHIHYVKNYNIILINGEVLHISRSRIFGFKRAFSTYLGSKYKTKDGERCDIT